MKNPYDNIAAISKLIRMQEMLNPYSSIQNISALLQILENQKKMTNPIPAIEMQEKLLKTVQSISQVQEVVNQAQLVINSSNQQLAIVQEALMNQTAILKTVTPDAINKIQDQLNILSKISTPDVLANNIGEIADSIKAFQIPEGFSFEETRKELDNILKSENLEDNAFDKPLHNLSNNVDESAYTTSSKTDAASNDEFEDLSDIEALLTRLYCDLFTNWNHQTFEDAMSITISFLNCASSNSQIMSLFNSTYEFLLSITNLLSILAAAKCVDSFNKKLNRKNK